MDIYRVTRKGFGPSRPTLGTKTAAHATAGYVKATNAYYVKAANAYYKSHDSTKRVSVTIERAQVGEFTDVTAEFLEDQ